MHLFPSSYPTFFANFARMSSNDHLGRKVHVKCDSDDTIGDLKKLIAAQTGTDSTKVYSRNHNGDKGKAILIHNRYNSRSGILFIKTT